MRARTCAHLAPVGGKCPTCGARVGTCQNCGELIALSVEGYIGYHTALRDLCNGLRAACTMSPLRREMIEQHHIGFAGRVTLGAYSDPPTRALPRRPQHPAAQVARHGHAWDTYGIHESQAEGVASLRGHRAICRGPSTSSQWF